jgi:hypothetical protein
MLAAQQPITAACSPAPPTPETPKMLEIPTPPDYTIMFSAMMVLIAIAIIIGIYSIRAHFFNHINSFEECKYG